MSRSSPFTRAEHESMARWLSGCEAAHIAVLRCVTHRPRRHGPPAKAVEPSLITSIIHALGSEAPLSVYFGEWRGEGGAHHWDRMREALALPCDYSRALTLEEHWRVGQVVKRLDGAMRRALQLTVNRYPKAHPAVRAFWRADKGLARLQSALDDIVCGDFPRASNAICFGCYYNFWGDHSTDIAFADACAQTGDAPAERAA